MTREESWEVEGITLTPLRHIESLGYVVSVHRLGDSLLGRPGSIEMHATDTRTDPPQVHVASVARDESGDVDYRCACELAAMVGIELQDC
jgi:hypothetical protein